MTLRPYSADLQKQYRDTMGTPGAPEVVDDAIPVVPVAVVAQVPSSSSAQYVRITDGTDTAQVNNMGGGTLGVIGWPADATLVNAFLQNAATTTTIYTVPAGQTFYMMGMIYTAADGAAISNVAITENGSPAVVFRHGGAGANDAQPTLITGGGFPIYVFGGGATVAFTTNGSNAYITIWGFRV